MFNIPRLLLLLAFSLAANAQTTTTTDANGRTVIGVISTNPQGQTTTRFSTLTGVSTTSTANTRTTSTTTQGHGPVAQPAPTTATAGEPFPYTYTTVESGITRTVLDTFTPTSPPTVSVTPPAIGTLWDYSSWSSVYGPPTATGGGSRLTVPEILSGLGGAFTFLVWVSWR